MKLLAWDAHSYDALPLPHERWGETVLAIVVREPGADVTAAQVIAHARERLAHYKCPTVIEIVDTLPHSSTGKIARARLREGSA